MPGILRIGGHVQRRQPVEIARIAVCTDGNQCLKSAGIRIGGRQVQWRRALLGAQITTAGLGLEQLGDLRPTAGSGSIVNRLIGRHGLQFAALRSSPQHQREGKAEQQQRSMRHHGGFIGQLDCEPPLCRESLLRLRLHNDLIRNSRQDNRD